MTRAVFTLCSAAAIFLIAGATFEAKAAGAESWARLFNGRNLDGWEAVNGGQWTVEDGAIVMRRVPGNNGGAWLFTKRDYGDFILRLKFMPGAETFHSGILIRESGHGKITRPAF